MYSKFDDIKMNPQCYFSLKCVGSFFWVRLLEIKKYIEGLNRRF